MNFKESIKKLSNSRRVAGVIAILLFIVLILFFSKIVVDKAVEMSKTSETCVPYGIEVNSTSPTEAKITWKTDKSCISYVKYGLSIEELPYESISNSSRAKDHDASLSKLQSGFNYYYVIISDSKEYGIDGLPLSFSTKAF